MSTHTYVFMEKYEKYFPDTYSYLELWILVFLLISLQNTYVVELVGTH